MQSGRKRTVSNETQKGNLPALWLYLALKQAEARASLPGLSQADNACSKGWREMSLKQLLEVWGFTDRAPIVEEAKGSAPTVLEGGKPYSSSDDGAGWNNGKREIRTTPPPANERHLWQEHAPGLWHRRG
jgi:hypothetical protein